MKIDTECKVCAAGDVKPIVYVGHMSISANVADVVRSLLSTINCAKSLQEFLLLRMNSVHIYTNNNYTFVQ